MKRVVWLTSARTVASLSQALNLILLARGVPPDAFGVASAFLGVCLFVIVAADMGVSTVLLRYGRTAESPTQPEARHVSSAYATAWLQAAVVGVLSWLIGDLFFEGLAILLVGATALWATSERVFESVFSGLIAQESHTRANLLLVVRRVAALAVQLVLLALGVDGVSAFSYSLLAGVVAGVASLTGCRLRHLRCSRPFAYPVRESLGFWMASAASQSRDLETSVVHAVSTATQAGLHGVAYRLQRPVALVAMSMAQLSLPRVSKQPTLAAREVRLVWGTAAAALLMTCATLPLVGPAIELVLGAEYAPALLVCQLALLCSVPFAFCAPLGAVLQALGRAKEVAMIGLSFAVAGLLGTGLGAAVGGAAGAVLGCGAAYLAKFVVLSVRARALATQRLGARAPRT